jgi:beta-glucosidase
VLLYPKDLVAVVHALEKAVETGTLDRERIQHSLRRRQKWAQWASPPNEYRRASAADVAWGATLADRVIQVVRGAPPRVTSPVEIIVVDDDLGGPYPAPSRDPFLRALSIGGVEVKRVEKPSGDGRASVVIALFGDIRSWKGRPGYSPEARKAVDKVIDKAPEAIVVQFSHPRLATELKKPTHVVSAWGGETVMQQAAARWLVKSR